MSLVEALRLRELPRLPLGAAGTFVIGTILLAGTIHISAILLVPVFATADGWSRLEPFAGDHQFAEIIASRPGAETVPGIDPLFINGACRLSLDETPAEIVLEGEDRFWSLALYDPDGTIIFSLNDRTAVSRRLDMIIVSPEQNRTLGETLSAEMESKIVVESASDELIALLRLFASTPSAQREARGILDAAECLSAPDLMAEPSA
jgi:uncharacterized membrane protein